LRGERGAGKKEYKIDNSDLKSATPKIAPKSYVFAAIKHDPFDALRSPLNFQLPWRETDLFNLGKDRDLRHIDRHWYRVG
jgi:hypothetical protein